MEVAPILNVNKINSSEDSMPSAELAQSEKELKKVCEDFEAVFLSYVISQMRKSSEGEESLMNEDSTAMKIYKEMLDEEYAIQMARSGQIGIAQMLFEQLQGSLTQQASDIGEGLPAQSLPLNADLAMQFAMMSENSDNLAENLMNQHFQSIIDNQQSTITDTNLTRTVSDRLGDLQSVISNQQSPITDQQSLIINNQLPINEPQPLPPLQTENRIMLQIVQKLSPTLQTGVREAIINLEPPDLGHLHIRLALDANNILSARINVDNSSVANALNNNLTDLRTSLSEHGIQIDSFNISVGTDLGQLNRGSTNPGQYQDEFRGSSSIRNLAGTRSTGSVDRQMALTEARYFVNYLV